MSGPAVPFRVRRRASRSRPAPTPRAVTAPTPPLCRSDAHVWRFVDRVQLGLPDVTLGGYPLASYLACAQCVGVVEFMGVCDVTTGKTHLNSALLLLPDGSRWSLPLPAQRVLLVPQG